MSKNTGYARNIFFSLIISVIILLGIGFISVNYLVPLYDLQSQDIYQFMIYILPIIIGVAFIEIGAMISSKRRISESDLYDELPRNSYDDPLYTAINDDPQKTDYMTKTKSEFIQIKKDDVNVDNPEVDHQFETIANPVNTTVVNAISTLPKPMQERLLSLTDKEAERILTFLANDPNYYESSLETTTAEKLLTLGEEDARKLLYWLEQDAILVDATNIVGADMDSIGLTDAIVLPFDKETSNAIQKFSPKQAQNAVDYILNGEKTEFISVPSTEDFDGSFNAILKTEISNAKDFGYEVSLVFLDIDTSECTEDYDMFIKNINSSCFNFPQKDGSIYLIFPLYNEREALEALNKAFNKINHTYTYGITTVKERYDINVLLLMNEALDNYKSQN